MTTVFILEVRVIDGDTIERQWRYSGVYGSQSAVQRGVNAPITWRESDEQSATFRNRWIGTLPHRQGYNEELRLTEVEAQS